VPGGCLEEATAAVCERRQGTWHEDETCEAVGLCAASGPSDPSDPSDDPAGPSCSAAPGAGPGGAAAARA
jgi:hypothetical protein